MAIIGISDEKCPQCGAVIMYGGVFSHCPQCGASLNPELDVDHKVARLLAEENQDNIEFDEEVSENIGTDAEFDEDLSNYAKYRAEYEQALSDAEHAIKHSESCLVEPDATSASWGLWLSYKDLARINKNTVWDIAHHPEQYADFRDKQESTKKELISSLSGEAINNNVVYMQALYEELYDLPALHHIVEHFSA